jgi:hypothetical protein
MNDLARFTAAATRELNNSLLQALEGSPDLADPSDPPSVPSDPQLIFQLGEEPFPLDLESYANARGPANPNGDSIPLFRFSVLVDTIPIFARNYSYFLSHESTEALYGQALNHARPAVQGRVAEKLTRLKRLYEDARQPLLSGDGTYWRPSYAVPDDWWDEGAAFIPARITPDDPVPSSGLTLLPGSSSLKWRLEGLPGEAPTDDSTIIRDVRFEYRLVRVHRPWLNWAIFGLNGVEYPNLSPGYFSSGSAEHNSGRMPLITTGFLLARNMRITATWVGDDRAIANLVQSGRLRGSLGPFVVGERNPIPAVDAIRNLLSSSKWDAFSKDFSSVYRLPQAASTWVVPVDDGQDSIINRNMQVASIHINSPEFVLPSRLNMYPWNGKKWTFAPLNETEPVQSSEDSAVVTYARPQIIGWLSRLVPTWPQ